MIVAIILCNRTEAVSDGKPAYFPPLGEETAIERLIQVVARGPFGGTLVASAAPLAAEMRQTLAGFTVQHVELAPAAPGSVAELLPAFRAAEAFRGRWEKAHAAATGRFGGKQPEAEEGPDWKKLRGSADVRVRGLARSFDRDGVMLFRGDQPGLSLDVQAHLSEHFGRDASASAAGLRTSYAGQPDYPVVLGLEAVREVLALPPETLLDDWLAEQTARIKAVPVNNPGVTERLLSDSAYRSVRAQMVQQN